MPATSATLAAWFSLCLSVELAILGRTMMTMKLSWLLTGLLLVQLIGVRAEAQEVLFTPESGLSGESRGDGALRLLLGRWRPFRVQSFGSSAGDGTFTLQQTVTFEGEPPRVRTWVIREVATLEYTGTLTDASGRVQGRTSGSRLTLKYRLKGPLVMHQVLDLSADGKTIANSGRITFLGVPVGRLRETIRR